MKLLPLTLQVLKNFSTINPSLIVKAGNIVRTMSPAKTIIGKAILSQDFPVDFAIYDLPRFLGTISLFVDPDLVFEDKFVTLNETAENNGENSFKYVYTDPSLLVNPPQTFDLKKTYGKVCTLSADSLKNTLRAINVSNLPEIVFSGNGEDVFLQAADTKEKTKDMYSIKLGKFDKKFKLVIKQENIKNLIQDYDVEISPQGVAHFEGCEEDMEYWVAAESNSTFE